MSDNSLAGTIPSSIGNLNLLQDLYVMDGIQSNNDDTHSRSHIGWRLVLAGGCTATLSMAPFRRRSVTSPSSRTCTPRRSTPRRQAHPSDVHNTLDEHSGLFDNQLSGTIPSSIGNLRSVVYLYLNDNQLSGTIPSSISGLSRVINLYAIIMLTHSTSMTEVSSLSVAGT
mgnify:CR=1 FL=1